MVDNPDPFTLACRATVRKGLVAGYAETVAAVGVQIEEAMADCIYGKPIPKREPEVTEYILERRLLRRLGRG